MQGGGMGTGNSSADFGYQGGDVDSGSTLGITTRSGLVLGAGSSLRPGGADGAGEVHSHGYSSGISQQLDVSFQKEPHVLVQSGGLQGMPLPQSLMQQGSERLQLNISTRGADASGASRTHGATPPSVHRSVSTDSLSGDSAMLQSPSPLPTSPITHWQDLFDEEDMDESLSDSQEKLPYSNRNSRDMDLSSSLGAEGYAVAQQEQIQPYESSSQTRQYEASSAHNTHYTLQLQAPAQTRTSPLAHGW
eukprot:CAMPEP_0179409778 /NCGR_PEP_ID=MMETSP0799-20121207/2901_1 /TAXON_ID=46947 /ORGANISM="Geminigera cryophila, Strain CCMP2564" /LENGTH=247 /DNA_ID=CAMNT_0021181515 /DNA_START=377 /DNA_END=1117 /DNA_ORIENTATION=-